METNTGDKANPKPKFLYAGGAGGNLYVYNLESQKLEKTYEKLMERLIRSLVLTSDKSQLFIPDWEGKLK